MAEKGLSVNPFFWVLIASLLIFFIGGFLAGFSENQTYVKKGKYLFSEDFGRIGDTEATFNDIILGDFSVGFTEGERTVREIDNYEIRNGFMSKRDLVIEFNSLNPENGFVDFNVSSTNLYGNLRIFSNGEMVFNSKAMPSSHVNVELKNLRNGLNRIVISSQSSGLKFWAPTIYDLRDIRVRVNDFSKKKFSKIFRVRDYEREGFDRGEIIFFVNKAIREKPLVIKINNVTVYEDKPIRRPSPYTVIFSAKETGIVTGENVVEISTGENGMYEIENALMKIFYFARPNKTTLFREFFITSSDYKKLRNDEFQGKIEFDATIYLRGDFRIILNNQTYDLFLRNGINRIFFNAKDVHQGKNILKIETTSTLDLNNFTISVVKRR